MPLTSKNSFVVTFCYINILQILEPTRMEVKSYKIIVTKIHIFINTGKNKENLLNNYIISLELLG